MQRYEKLLYLWVMKIINNTNLLTYYENKLPTYVVVCRGSDNNNGSNSGEAA